MNENSNIASSSRKRSQKKRSFNIIDFLIIVLALLVVGALVYVFLPTSWVKNLTADRTETIHYSIEILGVDEEFLECIKENDKVLDSVTKNDLGTVTAVDYGIQYTQLEYSNEAQAGVLSPVAGKYNVIVTISATAEFEQGEGYSVNGKRIAAGEKIAARFPSYTCEAYCISVPVN